MRRAKITTLTNNADADALETARAALDATSGIPVLAGGQVSFTATITGEAIFSGNMVGYAHMPSTVNKDGSVSAFRWMRWAAGDMDLNNVAGLEVVKGPIDIPPGAARVIALPLVVAGTSASTTIEFGMFHHVPATIG